MTTPLTRQDIGALIRKARKEAGMTGGELGEKIGISQSKISKVESGLHTRNDYAIIKKIVNILNMSTNILQRLDDSLIAGVPDGIKFFSTFTSHIGDAESGSKVIRVYSSSLIPALLQTTSYQSALHLCNGNPDALQMVKATSERQTRMWEGGCDYHFVLAEAALYTSFTSNKIHAAQLANLERYVDVPHISIGIIPTTAGMPPLDIGSFGIYDKRMMCDAIMHREVISTNQYDIDISVKAFAVMQNLAHYGEEAIELIRNAASTLR